MNKPTAIKRFIILIVFMVIGFLLTFCSFEIPFTNYTYNGFANSIKLGLDIKGGVLLIGDASPSEDRDSTNFEQDLKATQERLSSVLASEGYTEAVVTIQQGNRIRVEVPDVNDPEAVLNLIGTPQKIEFRLDKDGEAVITGKHIKSVGASYQPSSSSGSEYEWGVTVNFTAEGESLFYQLTSDALNTSEKKIYIFANGEEISEPTVSTAIRGSTFISGSYDQKGAEDFALQIMSGTFSVDLNWGETSVISATLGVNALKYGLIAGIVGLVLIFAFMCWRYRMMGLLSSFALCFYIIIVMFLLQAIPYVQLTLEGIAGIILSIGMAIDANIIIFERIKEEYKQGKRLNLAINTGFKKGMPAIIDSNITTFIACVILMIFGTSSIQGFAITLFIGVAVSMFTSLVITRGLLNMYYPLNSTKPRYYALKREVNA
ncbi:MAG: protein translocase subunit SecD [Clostridia bacterium]|nr:protein translocase subunit SecD [Clostridia bacterium]